MIAPRPVDRQGIHPPRRHLVLSLVLGGSSCARSPRSDDRSDGPRPLARRPSLPERILEGRPPAGPVAHDPPPPRNARPPGVSPRPPAGLGETRAPRRRAPHPITEGGVRAHGRAQPGSDAELPPPRERPMGWETSTRRAELPPDWRRIRRMILERDGHRCTWLEDGGRCQAEATDVDHLAPGGPHTPENLRALCRWHHARKSSSEGNASRHRHRARREEPPHPGYI